MRDLQEETTVVEEAPQLPAAARPAAEKAPRARCTRASLDRAPTLERSPFTARTLARALLRLASRGARAGGRHAWRSRRCRQGLSIAILGVLGAFLSQAVRAHVEADTRFRVSKASLAATAPPPGLAREAVQDLVAIPLPGRSFSLYRDDAIPVIAATYARIPWVREVRRIEKSFPSKIRFDLVVRRPVAGLAREGRTYLVDEDGVILPRRCYEPSDPAVLHLPLIVNARLGRRHLREGEHVEDVPVRHGIAVALALRAEAFAPLRALPISIDVSNVNFELALNRPEVVVTAGGTVITWGRSEASPGQNLPLAEKLSNFSKAVKDRPLDRLSLVRLEFDQVEWRERAQPEEAPAPN